MQMSTLISPLDVPLLICKSFLPAEKDVRKSIRNCNKRARSCARIEQTREATIKGLTNTQTKSDKQWKEFNSGQVGSSASSSRSGSIASVVGEEA